MARKLSNSFAYRFNKLAASIQAPFSIRLNNKDFDIPLMGGTLGESNTQLEDGWLASFLSSLHLPQDTDFIDIGANVGQTLLAFRSIYSNAYWGFEPNPICNFYLEELIKANHFKNVSILPVGLAAQNSLVSFFFKHSHDTGATIVSGFRQEYYQPEDVKYVPVFSFDELKLNTKKISLIKIDVEGAELGVISGMLETIRQHQPIILCEVLDYHSIGSRDAAQDRANQLLGHFKQLNYSVHRVVHTSHDVRYEPVTEIKLQPFTEASYNLNDYLFLPAHIPSLLTSK